PGNVRELENVIERALVLAGGSDLLDRDVIALGRGEAQGPAAASLQSGSLALDEAMRAHIERVLALTEGRVHGPDGAAALLKLNPSTLRHRMNKLGVVYGRRAREEPPSTGI
ncbi:MAG: sigma-54-dependent Fis family transcriptional regulator, partial [Acidobacteriota bacterium]